MSGESGEVAEERLLIANELGMHARAATKFVQAANKFQSSVFVETAPWTFEKRTVEVGEQLGDDRIVVTKGLDVGTRIVSSNAVLLP